MWLRRMERATGRSAQWLQSPHTSMPHGRDTRPRSQRRTESPVGARSGIGAISERDMLHAVLMVSTDCQIDMRADEDTFMNVPLTSAPRPHMKDEYHTAWIFEKNPVTGEEARGCMNVFTPLTRIDSVFEQRRRKGMPGTTLSEVPGIFG
eukprot:8836275-Pyramimonas_sp.AAC.1